MCVCVCVRVCLCIVTVEKESWKCNEQLCGDFVMYVCMGVCVCLCCSCKDSPVISNIYDGQL